jgi:hypothetical protein
MIKKKLVHPENEKLVLPIRMVIIKTGKALVYCIYTHGEHDIIHSLTFRDGVMVSEDADGRQDAIRRRKRWRLIALRDIQ